MQQRIIQTSVIEEDIKNDNVLRPQFLKDYVGQKDIKSNIQICIKAALDRGEALDHVLFYGPPGLGKTTLACIIANELGSDIKVTSGPAIEKPGDMAAILSGLKRGDVLFIDEIHRLARQVEEVLYTAMEDFAIDIMIGKGQTAKSVRIDLEPFTLVGATTKAGSLSAPLRDRFGLIHRLEFYTDEELTTIINNSANKLGVKIEESGAIELAKRSRGTPRIANRFLKRVRDYAQVRYDNVITEAVAKEVLDLMDVDDKGLDKTDRLILKTMIENYGGKPVGISAIAASIGEDPDTIEDVYEPFLVLKGYINRTPRGRMVTDAAYEHLGLVQ
ncbi:MAG: Holliday junction branch migration DNA helicase RuvB [Lachnospiraceae bacterium]|nr:Holliday junction branch migration DNA helicase RuvB [Lachnospiraceae bacterium]